MCIPIIRFTCNLCPNSRKPVKGTTLAQLTQISWPRQPSVSPGTFTCKFNRFEVTLSVKQMKLGVEPAPTPASKRFRWPQWKSHTEAHQPNPGPGEVPRTRLLPAKLLLHQPTQPAGRSRGWVRSKSRKPHFWHLAAYRIGSHGLAPSCRLARPPLFLSMAANTPFTSSPKSQRRKLILFVNHKPYRIKESKDAGRAIWVHGGGDAQRGGRLTAKCPKLGDNSGAAPEAGANRAFGSVRQGGRFLGGRWWSGGTTATPHAACGGRRAPGLSKGQDKGRKDDTERGKGDTAARYTCPRVA